MAFWSRWFRRPDPKSGAPRSEPESAAPEVEFPYPVVPVLADSVVQEWRRLREAWGPEGCAPVLVGDAEVVGATRQVVSSGNPSEILREAAASEADEFFQRRRRELQDTFEPSGDEQEEADPSDPEPEEFRAAPGLFVPMGSWEPSLATRHDPAAYWARRAKRILYLAKIPTTRSWEVPAYLNYGGWNECPAPEDHVAVLRHWHERYGAEVFSVAGDVVECWVARPPRDRAGCEALAREQANHRGSG